MVFNRRARVSALLLSLGTVVLSMFPFGKKGKPDGGGPPLKYARVTFHRVNENHTLRVVFARNKD